MTLLNGLVLGVGGLLLLVPIILHFLMQPKPKEMLFPALRFIKKKQTKNRRQMRLRHLLLLILRCLLILALAAALAGPTVATGSFGNWMTLGSIWFIALLIAVLLVFSWMRKSRNSLLISVLGIMLFAVLAYGSWVAYKIWTTNEAPVVGDTQAPVAAVLIVDTSPRMLYQHDNRQAIERAQEMGDWLISQFPLDSQVSILLNDGDSAYFSVDVSSAQKRLDTASVSYTSGNLPDTILEGLKLLESSDLERKEMYVLTDLTRRSWSGTDPIKMANQMNENTSSIYVIDVGTDQTVNHSVNAIRLETSTIAKNNPLKIQADLLRLGPAAERTVRLQLEKRNEKLPVFRDGQSVVPEGGFEIRKTVNFTENGATSLEFKTSQKLEPGIHHGVIEIVGSDGLSIDDQKYFTINVRDAWKVLIVHPSNVRPGNLVAAIEAQSAYETETILESDLSSVDLSSFNALFWLNPTPQSDTTWTSLRKYVERGGGLAIMLGHNAQNGAEADASFASDAAQTMLTGKLTFPFRAPKPQRAGAERGFFLSPDALSHPILTVYRGIEDIFDWTDFRVQYHWALEADSAEFPTQTIVRYNNQESALIERQIGEGNVLIFTTPIPEAIYPEEDRPSWNSLFAGENYPTWLLVRQMTKYLAGARNDHLNMGIGDTAVLENDLKKFPEQYSVFTPDFEKPPTQTKSIDDVVRYKFTQLPGQYRLKGNLMGPVLRGFSVNLSPSDTDLSRVSLEELNGILGDGNFQLAKEKEEVQRKQGALREGQSFYPMLIFMMLILLALELLMSNLFYRTKPATTG